MVSAALRRLYGGGDGEPQIFPLVSHEEAVVGWTNVHWGSAPGSFPSLKSVWAIPALVLSQTHGVLTIISFGPGCSGFLCSTHTHAEGPCLSRQLSPLMPFTSWADVDTIRRRMLLLGQFWMLLLIVSARKFASKADAWIPGPDIRWQVVWAHRACSDE